ncbi:MAG: hypothetical protein K0Q64_1453 [Nitrobacter vulgaris]|jgi:hypothetical protein|nr:hypothetical protein [Nitrobacter vulgaris]
MIDGLYPDLEEIQRSGLLSVRANCVRDRAGDRPPGVHYFKTMDKSLLVTVSFH